ncbi:MAG: sulfotransferase [Myxococcota bacterium]
MQDRLIFLIGSPRSGTTLLSRMIGAHSSVVAPPEPHLMPPLAHLGYHESVQTAPYDPYITRQGLREFVGSLPGGEQDYLDALRAMTDTLYRRALEAEDARWFLDKTPAYALVLDFLARLYPSARYVVITRHPLAVWSSFVESFFDGDHEVAHAHNPLLERYVPAIARFLREQPVPLRHVRYEDLVREPEQEIQGICDFLGLPFEPGMIDYGSGEEGTKTAPRGLGDPMTVGRESRPTTRSIGKWAQQLGSDPGKLAQAREILGRLLDPDLETWGHPRGEIEAELEAVRSTDAAPRRRLSRYRLERKLVVALRRNIHTNALGRLVRRARDLCDVLLR